MRRIVERAEEFLDKVIPVLDHGFVRLVDYMGSDESVAEAARVSTAGGGVRSSSDDEALIRYLMRERHTSPFEMVELKFHCAMPIFVARQWVRHRTACLTGDMPISFDLPGRLATGNRRHYVLTVKQIYDRWQPTRNTQRPDKQRNPHYRREQVQQMCLRSVNEETGEVYATSLTNIVMSGVKEVLSVHFSDGSWLRATDDHKCLTSLGWLTLREGLDLKAAFSGVGKREVPPRKVDPLAEDEIDLEEWRSIPGFPECYEVSDLGRVRNWNNTQGRRLDLPTIKEATLVDGYPSVSLSWSGKSRLFRVHKLVLTAFEGVAGDDEEARHLDGCRSNSRLSNLAWGTSLENAGDRMVQGGDQRLARCWVDVVSWSSDGLEEVYDISVAGPYHNFIAGGVVVHNSLNEMSGRYSQLPELTYVPDAERISWQSAANKQGSGGAVPAELAERVRDELRQESASAFALYDELLGRESHESFADEDFKVLSESGGVSRELARINLPLSTYTQWYWKVDLHNLFHFLQLRLDEHAQWELRQYAQKIAEVVAALCPVSWRAFEDYRLRAVTLSGPELEVMRHLFSLSPTRGALPLDEEHSRLLSSRELGELQVKLRRMGGFGIADS